MAQTDMVSGKLSDANLARLRGAYKRDDMTKILLGTLPLVYAHCQEYVQAIGDLLYGGLPEEGERWARPTLSVQDRERCLIAILGSREAGLALAIHIYIALMENISPEEVAHILLLVGIYSGVDHLTGGLMTEVKLLGALDAFASKGGNLTANAVKNELMTVFQAA